MDKEILLITNYFPPEKGAAPNRMFAMATGFGSSGYKVNVVCPLPNYPNGKIYKDYRYKLYSAQKTDSGKISRLWVWPSNSTNKIVRLLSMLSFSMSLIIFFILNKTPKKVFIQYSPVFIGFTAVVLGRLFSKKIILNVSDLWPLAGLEMGILKEGFYYNLMLKMERYCYRNSSIIVGQSQEILDHVSKLENKKPLFLYRNIPNFPIRRVIEPASNKKVKIVYAGLLGMAQGIYEICQRISFPENVSFHIYGAGPEAEKISSIQKPNITYHGELDRDSLHKALSQYDIAFIPLIKRIYGSVPSKIFEYCRLGLPVLYYAGGEGGDLVNEKSLGWVIPNNDFEALQNFLNNLSNSELNRFPKQMVQENCAKAFDFERQFKSFVTTIETI